MTSTTMARAMNYGKVSEGWIKNMWNPPHQLTNMNAKYWLFNRCQNVPSLTRLHLFIYLFVYFYMVKPVISNSKYIKLIIWKGCRRKWPGLIWAREITFTVTYLLKLICMLFKENCITFVILMFCLVLIGYIFLVLTIVSS